VIPLLADLLAIRSTADRPGELARALELVIAEAGPGFAVRRFESRGKPSALLHPPGAGELRVILNAHLDVVPAPDEQFVPRREGRPAVRPGARTT
jgi:succinyl-diaminopimelate desuccinylase